MGWWCNDCGCEHETTGCPNPKVKFFPLVNSTDPLLAPYSPQAVGIDNSCEILNILKSINESLKTIEMHLQRIDNNVETMRLRR